jgi:hypothetical protein
MVALEPIPKIDNHIDSGIISKSVTCIRVEHLPTIRNIPDELWDEIKL